MDYIREFINTISCPCKDSKEKYNQIKEHLVKNDIFYFMEDTIKHALKQSTLVGSWNGYSLEFWIEVQGEYLKDN